MLTLNDGRTELWQWDTGRTLSVDADCSQVHFGNKVFGRSIDVDVADGVAIIPDVLLQTDKDLNVWAFVGTAENGYTKISKTFKVNRRNKPADYVFTPVEQTTIAEIAAIAQSVRDDADAGRFDGAQGPAGPAGAPGKDGKDGTNGITPHIGENGNWYIGNTDTGKLSRGEQGVKGDKGDTGPAGAPGPTYTAGENITISADNVISATGGGGGQVQPDWNQNDETAADYVKNRPFYTGDPVETVLVEETTVPFADDGDIYLAEFESTFVPTVGEIYKVSWDGTVYECTCVEGESVYFIGNLSFEGAGSDTGEPFCMDIYTDGYIDIVTADTSDSHTFSISGKQALIVKIPAKYIDKNASGYIAIHSNDTMTKQEAQNYMTAISKKEVVFIIWDRMCISGISFSQTTGYDLRLTTQNGESYLIAQNSEGLFNLNDRKIYQATFPSNKGKGDVSSKIDISKGKIRISSSSISSGVGTTDVLFYVQPNGTKSKAFEVLGNGEAVTPALILHSSTADSTKKFRITVDDSGTLKATDVT